MVFPCVLKMLMFSSCNPKFFAVRHIHYPVNPSSDPFHTDAVVSSSDHCRTDTVLPPSDYYYIGTVAPPGDHYCIYIIVVSSSDHCRTGTVLPPSDHYCIETIAPPPPTNSSTATDQRERYDQQTTMIFKCHQRAVVTAIEHSLPRPRVYGMPFRVNLRSPHL